MRHFAVLLILIASCARPFTPHAPRETPFARVPAPAGLSNVALLRPGGGAREGAIAISPAAPRIALAAAITGTTSFAVEVWRSIDGGQSWRSRGTLPLTVMSANGTKTLTGHYDPVLAFDRAGVAYLAVIGTAPNNRTDVVIYRSSDQGATWTGTDLTHSTTGIIDKPWVAVDDSGGRFDGSVYIVWVSAGGGSSQFHRAWSRNGGATWTEGPSFSGDTAPQIAIGPDSLVVISSLLPIRDEYAVYRSEDGGETLSEPAIVGKTIFHPPSAVPLSSAVFHQLAVDPVRGHMYIVFPSDDDGTHAPPGSVWFTRSADGGRTWSAPLRLSTRAADAALPSVSVDPLSGELVLSWLDRRDDVSNVLARLYTMRSHDFGATFDPPRAASSLLFVNGPLGDYNQLASFGGEHLAIFTDGGGHLSVSQIDSTPAPVPAPRRRIAGR